MIRTNNPILDSSDVDIAIITDMDRKAVKKYDSELMDAVTDIAMI